MKKKTFLVLLLALAMVFTACSSDSEEDSTEATTPTETEAKEEEKDDEKDDGDGDITTIEMLVPGYETGYLTEELGQCIEKFEEENPDKKVEVISCGWEELNSKVVQLYQAKNAPDIMMLGSRSLRQFAENGILQDMTDMLTDYQKENYIENVLDTGKVNGKQYGIPMSLSSRGLFYRSDLIENPPTNWDELLQVAKEQTKDGRKGFAIPTDLTSGTDEILNFIYQNGGRIVDEDGNYVINSEENIETLEYFQELADYVADPVSTARDDQAKMFVNDDLAMYISGGWEKEVMDENKDETPYKLAMIPEGKEKAVTVVTDSYTMSSISENKEAAFEFIEFMGQLENQKLITGSHGWFPVLKEEAENDIYHDEFNEPMYAMIEYGIPEPRVPNWDDFNKSFTIAVQKAMTGELSAEEALNNCQAELER